MHGYHQQISFYFISFVKFEGKIYSISMIKKNTLRVHEDRRTLCVLTETINLSGELMNILFYRQHTVYAIKCQDQLVNL